jgi:chaperonin cofactor prefoldin
MPRQHENDPHMNGDLHQISAEIGGIKKAVEIMTALWREQEASASVGRRSLHDKLEALKNDVGLQISGLSLRVDRLTDKVTMIEPSVTSFKEKIESCRDDALIEEGAKRFRGRLGAVLVALAGAVGWVLNELIAYIKH